MYESMEKRIHMGQARQIWEIANHEQKEISGVIEDAEPCSCMILHVGNQYEVQPVLGCKKSFHTHPSVAIAWFPSPADYSAFLYNLLEGQERVEYVFTEIGVWTIHVCPDLFFHLVFDATLIESFSFLMYAVFLSRYRLFIENNNYRRKKDMDEQNTEKRQMNEKKKEYRRKNEKHLRLFLQDYCHWMTNFDLFFVFVETLDHTNSDSSCDHGSVTSHASHVSLQQTTIEWLRANCQVCPSICKNNKWEWNAVLENHSVLKHRRLFQNVCFVSWNEKTLLSGQYDNKHCQQQQQQHQHDMSVLQELFTPLVL
jgi:hypothetical protein